MAQPGVLNRYLNKREAEDIQNVFTGLYSLEFVSYIIVYISFYDKVCLDPKKNIRQDEHGEKAVARGIADPTKYVLKPQREGGGNNIYDENVRTALESMKDSKERTAWILMDRINPPIHKNYLIRSGMVGECKLQDLVSELGIYGVVIGYVSSFEVTVSFSTRNTDLS